MIRMKIVSTLISASMLLSVVGSLGTAIPVQTVDAEHNSEKSVYYFSDTEPILDESDMKYYFGHSNNYEYDLQYGVNQKAFAQMVEEFHFEDYAGYDIYLFQVKLLLPEASRLEEIFSSWKAQSDCSIIFICSYTPYDLTTMLEGSEFMTYVDEYYQCSLHGFAQFVNYAVYDLVNNYDFDTILIDVTFLNENCEMTDIYECIRASVFLPLFLKALGEQWIEGGLPTLFVGVVSGQFDFYICNGTEIYDFEGLITGNELTSDGIGEVSGHQNCFFGVWQLDPGLYNFLWEEQDGKFDDFPVYIWEQDPIEYDPDGLKIMSDSSLAAKYGYDPEDNNDAAELKELLSEYLD